MALSIHGEEDDEELYVQPFTINLHLVTAIHEQPIRALIDLGVDCNVMSYGMWCLLGKPTLHPSKLSFKSFTGAKTTSMGKLCIDAQLHG